MFFVMVDIPFQGKVYQRRVGQMDTSFSKAVRKARRVSGYIVNENRDVVAQAYDPSYPRHVDSLVNISSGEDVV